MPTAETTSGKQERPGWGGPGRAEGLRSAGPTGGDGGAGRCSHMPVEPWGGLDLGYTRHLEGSLSFWGFSQP